MHRLLVIHDEALLYKALQDVGALFQYESHRSITSDLLAVIVMPKPGMDRLFPEDHSQALFDLESVSLEGVWLLLTISPSVFPESASREQSLVKLLDLLRSRKCFESGAKVLPVLPWQEGSGAVTDNLTLLRETHPDLLPAAGFDVVVFARTEVGMKADSTTV